MQAVMHDITSQLAMVRRQPKPDACWAIKSALGDGDLAVLAGVMKIDGVGEELGAVASNGGA
jgi:hypothetical protein